MTAISLTLLLVAALGTTLGGAALVTARGLRRQLDVLQAQLAHGVPVTAAGTDPALPHGVPDTGHPVPAPRSALPREEIRAAVAAALAEERERELAEARAFWAEQEARGSDSDAPLLEGRGTEYEISEVSGLDALLEDERGNPCDGFPDSPRDAHVFVPRQPGPQDADLADDAPPQPEAESAELAAARRRHPSQPEFTLRGDPVVGGARDGAASPAERERTVERLEELAASRTPLTDVRPGPLGTLDVYVFQDGTTVCMSPGHRETAGRLARALADGEAPELLGGSGVSGAYTLTFACGDESVYVLADRVIATL